MSQSAQFLGFVVPLAMKAFGSIAVWDEAVGRVRCPPVPRIELEADAPVPRVEHWTTST